MVEHLSGRNVEALIDYLFALAGEEDPEFASDLLESFIASVEECTEGLVDAVARGERARAGRMAHRMKSSFATLGLDEGAHACEVLEKLAHRGGESLDDALAAVLTLVRRDGVRAAAARDRLRGGHV